MVDLWNFKDTVFVASNNALWLFVAMVFGGVVGWLTYEPDRPAE
jgi:hypothetical protein